MLSSSSYITLILLLLHSITPILHSALTSLSSDESTLLAFKNQINPKSILAPNWTSSSPICNWVGVSCGGRHGRITALKLPHLGLQGTIPPTLGNLSFLASLNLTHNSFHGSLPKELSRLRRLKFLDLSFNFLSGEIPSDLGDLPNLQSLFIRYNNLTGTIPTSLFNISTLEVLSLSYNSIQGKIPSNSFSELPNMKILALENNKLSGSIPAAIFNISSVQSVDLSSNLLSGKLPDDMCDSLPKLEFLSLSENGLDGEIPLSLGKCGILEVLGLSVNRFSGKIPTSLGNLTMLKELYIGYTDLEGQIPQEMGKLINLEIFSASNTRGFVGSIPPSLFNISSLIEFSLQNNSLSGEIPNEVENLENLRYFNVGENKLVGRIPPAIFNISTMTFLYLQNNFLSGSVPSTIGLGLPNLEQIFLWRNNLTGRIPESISNASVLTILDLAQNSFSGMFPSTLGNLKFLRLLYLNDNYLTAKSSNGECRVLSSLSNCRELETLEISNNPLSCLLPASVGNLSTSLLYFHASYCKLKGHIPMEIGNLSNTLKLALQQNELMGSIPTSVGRLQNLQHLYLAINKLSGSVPAELCRLKNLEILSLHDNNLSGELPTCLSSMDSLRNLYLDSNNLSSNIPMSLWSLTFILEVNLSSNSLTGPLSFDVGNLKVMTDFDLSENRISGNIPSSIGGLKDLGYLSLANNDFQGPIPQSFGDLISLEILDLSGNELSGVIPKSLVALSSLNEFNVSFNLLEGEIPAGGSFGNFSYQSFEHNYGLCGSLRLRVPPCKASSSLKRSKMATSTLLKYILLPVVSAIILVVLGAFVFICTKRRKQVNIPDQESSLPLATWRKISYVELQRATDGFNESNLLGMGSFGSVYKGELSNGIMNIVAVKVFNLQFEGAFKSFEVETDILSNIRHRNLVKIISCCCGADFKALVLEFMPNQSLESWLYSPDRRLNILERLNIMIDVASALEYLHHGHSTPIVHCDLKPSNVLLDKDMVAHVSDLGIAKLLGDEESIRQTMTLATIGYMAPEYGTMGLVSTKGDIYSFGILLTETFTRMKPTDEMFAGELSLRSWVEMSISDSDKTTFDHVVDANLLEENEQHVEAIPECISYVLRLALDCSADSPEDRDNMTENLATLKKIRQRLQKNTRRGRRPDRTFK